MAQNRLNTILTLLRPFRRLIVGLVSMTVVMSLLAMCPPLVIRSIVNDVITEGNTSLFVPLAAAMILVPVLAAGCGLLQVLGIAYIGQKFVLQFRSVLFKHLMYLSMRFYGKHSTGKLANRLLGDTTNLQQLLSVASIQIISDFVCAAFAIIVTFTLNWRLALPLVLLVVFFVVNYTINIGRIRKITRSYRSAEDRLAGGVQNRLSANLTVKSYGTEVREQDIFREHSDLALDLVRESEYATTGFSMNTMLLRDVGRVVVYFLGCSLVLKGDATYGDVIAFTAYSMQLLMPAVRFSTLAQQIQDVRISIDRLFELLDETPEVTSPVNPRHIKRARGKVDLNNVMFAYDEDRPVLRGIDLHVPQGETIALVGPTGCGKSTILSLLLRFFDPVEGSIHLDDVDIREYDLVDLRRQFGIVLQESLLFDVSIAENIRYSRQSATMEDIRHAAMVAEIHDTIEALPDGYDSQIGHRDIQLSVGQKQRISIARAVLADPVILIMDEATSALDSESEKAIQMAMDRFLVGRTSFIVAHRLSTIRNADRILLMDEGRVVEMGNHDQLMAIKGGKYHDLYEKHAGKGVIGDEES